MNETGIEWVRNPDGSQGYTWNPITGCLNHVNGLCKGGGFPCYAYKLAHTRLANRYTENRNTASPNLGQTNLCPEAISDPFYPRFWEERLNQIEVDVKSRGIFVCDMGDLFGIGVPEAWTRRVLDRCRLAFEHRFYLLTKQPQNLINFSPFPDNCWVGVTATNRKMLADAIYELNSIKAKVKYISIEPMLGRMFHEYDVFDEGQKTTIKLDGLPLGFDKLDWLIIGACTGSERDMWHLKTPYPTLSIMPFGNKWTAQPPIQWLREIVEAADQAGVKVFLKDNLEPLLDNELTIAERESLRIGMPGDIRQELPNG